MLTSRTFLLCFCCKPASSECGTFKLHFGPIIAEGFTYVFYIWDDEVDVELLLCRVEVTGKDEVMLLGFLLVCVAGRGIQSI